MLGLHCCADFSLVAVSRGYSLAAVQGLLLAMASLVATDRLQGLWTSAVAARGSSGCGFQDPGYRLHSCAAWAQCLCGMWGLPRPEIKPASSALAGIFFTSEPPGKPFIAVLLNLLSSAYFSEGMLLCSFLIFF